MLCTLQVCGVSFENFSLRTDTWMDMRRITIHNDSSFCFSIEPTTLLGLLSSLVSHHISKVQSILTKYTYLSKSSSRQDVSNTGPGPNLSCISLLPPFFISISPHFSFFLLFNSSPSSSYNPSKNQKSKSAHTKQGKKLTRRRDSKKVPSPTKNLCFPSHTKHCCLPNPFCKKGEEMLNTSALPEMLHCLNASSVNNGAATALKGGADTTVLEKQRAALKWQQEQLHIQLQQQLCYLNEFNMLSLPAQAQSFQGMISLDGPGFHTTESGSPHFGSRSGVTTLDLEHSGAHGDASCGGGYGVNYAQPRTIVGQEPIMVAAGAAAEKLSALAGRESFKKRKPEKSLPPQVDADQDDRTKKLRSAFGEKDETRSTDQQQNRSKNNTHNQNSTSTSNNNNNESKNRGASGCTSKENSTASFVQNPDYIHVRARRGQATDSHSLAERARREKISERMKYLQDLVPGCNKITGKAGMLDEIINYVQSLQRQVEFLSMKLATVNPRLDFNIEDLFAACSATQLAAAGIAPSTINQSYLQYNHPTVQQAMAPVCSSELGGNPMGLNIRQPNGATLSLPETFADSSSFNQVQNPLPWEAELQNIFAMEYFQQARSNAFPSQTFTGPINEAASLKMEI